MVYNRGSAADYDEMAALGNPGWGWRHILPVFRTIENHELGPDSMRGSGGPLEISVDTHLPQICNDVIAAGGKLGWSPTDDVNGGDAERIGPAPRTIKNGERVSAARAFLHPVTHRANLRVATDTTVNRVLFEGDKTVGVEKPPHGATRSATPPGAKSSCPSAAFQHRNCFNCPAWGIAPCSAAWEPTPSRTVPMSATACGNTVASPFSSGLTGPRATTDT